MRHLLLLSLAVAACAAGCTGAEPPGGEKAAARAIYEKWAASCEEMRVDPKAPLFLKLLRAPDADLFLLKGLHHQKDPVRRLSRLGLGRLKTDRSFAALVKALGDENMFVREKSLYALAEFRQPRCVPVLIGMLRTDPKSQIRHGAAYTLGDYEGEAVAQALLAALKDEEWVAATAALSLGKLRVEKAIRPTYDLIVKLKGYRARDVALDGLRYHKRKNVIPLLLDLMERLPKIDRVWGKWMAEKIDGDLSHYARQTEGIWKPLPDRAEQWRDWWKRSEPLFADDMKLKPKPVYRPRDFGTEAGDLEFFVSLDAKSCHVGDPMRMDLTMRNKSGKPYRIILPEVPSPWRSTMAYGVRLERTGEAGRVLLDFKPSPQYLGSYSGPPDFQTLAPGGTFKDSICLQHWLKARKIWPLAEGEYHLTVTFDSSKFAGIKAEGAELVGNWPAPAVKFTVAGAPRKDPEELLDLIGKKSGLRWLKADLTSKKPRRKRAAWLAVWEYGDSRLAPLLGNSPELRWGNLRQFKAPGRREEKAEP